MLPGGAGRADASNQNRQQYSPRDRRGWSHGASQRPILRTRTPGLAPFNLGARALRAKSRLWWKRLSLSCRQRPTKSRLANIHILGYKV
jgi:hypothetical protein